MNKKSDARYDDARKKRLIEHRFLDKISKKKKNSVNVCVTKYHGITSSRTVLTTDRRGRTVESNRT